MYIFIMTLCGCVILFSMIKSGSFFKSLLLSAIQGITAVFAVNLIGEFIGVHIAVNAFSGLVSAVAGLPGVIFLLVSNICTVL